MQRTPATYRVNANSAADELDYADMVVLAQTFVGWRAMDRTIPVSRSHPCAIGWLRRES